ncbi:MAG: tripartite tricarboxylate transporter substrate binding protein BugD [Betaproteobacteria bacterium]|jgi:tripartite-type tricarboxylate transporter receptor subunit TctC
MIKLFTSACVAAAAALASVCVSAQQFPSRPISIVVPFAAGGPTDIVARSVADAMTRSIPGANVIVDNAAGAGGTIGVAKVARASPDGYTLLVHHIGMATAPTLYRKLSFDPLKDFEYVGLINEVAMTLLVKTAMPVKDIRELFAYLKQNASKVSLANAGIGSASHLCGLLFMSAIATDLTTVPYKGTAPALADLMGGQVDLLCDQTTNTVPQIKSGKVRALAVTTPARLGILPDLPTLSESGLRDFDVSVWHGMYAPKGTPKAIVDRLVAALQQSLKDPTIVQRFGDLGTEPVAANKATPAALQAHLAAEIAKWAPLIKKAGTYAD